MLRNKNFFNLKHVRYVTVCSKPLRIVHCRNNTNITEFQTVAQEFCNFYYQLFDSDKSQLSNLYRDQSMLTFETTQCQGVKDIIEKLTSLPFQKVAHRISTLDAQPASPQGDILVMVTGELLVDEEQNAQRYSQVFHLIPEAGSYYVFNDIFRLNYS